MNNIEQDESGTKVWVQLEWEQVDAMVVKELKDSIEGTAQMVEAAKSHSSWVHPDDAEHNLKLLPALFLVYQHWAGEEAAAELKQQVGYEA